jgi:hypothetical protein
MASTGSGAPTPRRIGTTELTSRFLNLAQTSVYTVKIQPPAQVASYLNERGVNYAADGEGIELQCTQTLLPGHKLSTIDVANDYIGVSEKMAYRQAYDEAINFTFNVNYRYDVVQFFEGWIDFIAGRNGREQNAYVDRYANYRMNYPKSYRSDQVYITKFEKNVDHLNRTLGLGDTPSYRLDYTFVGAFPLAIIPAQISYNQSQILSYTVRMDYIRYVCERSVIG